MMKNIPDKSKNVIPPLPLPVLMLKHDCRYNYVTDVT